MSAGKKTIFSSLICYIIIVVLQPPVNNGGVILLPPLTYAATTLVDQLSFDFTTWNKAPTTVLWEANLVATNTSQGIQLTAPNDPGQGVYTTTGRTTATLWRVETSLVLNYTGGNSTTPDQPCPLAGFLFVDGVTMPTYTSDNLLTNFRGLAIWQEVCPGGSMKAFFSPSLTAVYNPDNDTNLLQCSSCTFGSTVPSSLNIVIQSVADRLTVATDYPYTSNYPTTCYSSADLNGFSSLAVTSPLAVSLAGLNGYNASVKVASFKFYQLAYITTYGSVYQFPFPYVLPTPYFTGYYDSALSFDGPSAIKFQYLTSGNATYITSAKTVTLVQGLPSTEGSIVSPQRIGYGATCFRAEISLKLKAFSTDWSPSYIYFILAESRSLPYSAETMMTNGYIGDEFQGIMLKVEISSNGLKYSLYYSTTPESNFALDGVNKHEGCLASQQSGLTAQDLVDSSATVIGIQFCQDLLSAAIFPQGLAKFPTTFQIFSNYKLSGLGEALGNMSEPSVQLVQWNSANTTANITVTKMSFWANKPMATTTTSTTTRTTALSTSTLTSIKATMAAEVLEQYATYVSPETGFPVPELTDGHAYPLVTFDDVMRCPFIKPGVRNPNLDNATDVYFSLTIDRLLSIKEVDETISISAKMYLQWAVDTCADSYTASSVADVERVFVTEPSKVWHPQLFFENSLDDFFMSSTEISSDMQILYLPTRPNRTLYFYWTQIGFLTSKCELDLRQFPFDAQTCDYTFLMKEPLRFVRFANIFLQAPELSSNSEWTLSGVSKSFGTGTSIIIRNGMSSFASFQVTLARNPNYHVYSLLAPCYVLITLVMASFMMPPEKPDRPVICCTILLAFVVAQSDVVSQVPKNSQRILIVDYIMLFTGLTGLVTLYHLLMCAIAGWRKTVGKLVFIRFCKMRLSVVRAIDVSAFLFAFDFLVMTNLYVITVIYE